MPDQLYDDNGKPITTGGVVYDDNGKPIPGSAPAVPHTGLDYYLQAAKDVGEGIGTSVSKTVHALNPFAAGPPRPTRAQQAAQLDAELKNAPPLNFDPRVTARTIWKGVTNLTAKDVGEGIGDVGQMYLMGKAAGAVEPETVRGVINTTLRGTDAAGRGMTAVGDAALPSSPLAATISAATNHPAAAVGTVAVPLALKYGGKGISAISRALQSEPLPPPPVPPSPAQSLGMNPEGGFTAGAGATSTGAATPPPAHGAGTQPWTVPQPPRPEPPPVTGTGTLITKPTPGPGTEPWTATRPAEPPPIVPTPTGTASPETVMGSPNVGWNQWTPGRDVVPAPKVPPEPNTQVTANDLGQWLEELRQQPADKPTTTSGPPPRTTTAGGRPSQTQAEYDALQEAAAQRRLAVEDELGAQAEKPAAASVAKEPPKGTDTIPSRDQMTPEELSRAREGARDSPDRQKGETVEDYRLRTAGRATGDKSAEPSIIPARRAGAIDDTIESMYERNATDQEFRDYLAKSKNHPKNGEIAAKIESKAHSYKRPSPLAHVIAGVAAGGAALRQALVGQLQGDQKEQD